MHFTNETSISSKGYKVYHTTHPDNKAKSGSAISIKESVMHHQHGSCQTECSKLHL